MKRVLKLTRVSVINAPTILWVPVMVLAFAAVISIAIFAITPVVSGPKISGGLNAPVWFFMVLGMQAVSHLLPFSLGLGATRRDYALSCFLLAFLSGIALSVVITVGGTLEGATSGWGHRWYFFRLPWMWANGWFAAFLLAAAITWCFYMLGFIFAALYKRLGMAALIVVLGALTLVLVGIVWVVVASAGWRGLSEWFNWFGPFSTACALTGLAAALAICGYAAIRRLPIR